MRDEQGSGGTAIDLRERVTVFVTTVGGPTFAACLAQLERQDCRFTLQILERVAPMTAAFQRMLDDCRTPYYVQVDEDMLLHPHAVRSLYERMVGAGPDTALCVARLYDAHLERRILGVKIFRHDIVRRYPFSALDALEIDQVARVQADGYRVVRDEVDDGDVLGRHGTAWTLTQIYERYMTLERRRHTRERRSDWFAEYGPIFLERFRRDPSRQNFFALMGIVAGALTGRQGPAMSKDWRTYAALPGFAALERFLAELDPQPSADPPADEEAAEQPAAAPDK
jgi:hypothetical protein